MKVPFSTGLLFIYFYLGVSWVGRIKQIKGGVSHWGAATIEVFPGVDMEGLPESS